MRKKLKQLRENKNMTHKEVAEKAGITRAYYTNIELGRKTPSLNVARKLKQILGFTDDNIFFADDVPNENNKEVS